MSHSDFSPCSYGFSTFMDKYITDMLHTTRALACSSNFFLATQHHILLLTDSLYKLQCPHMSVFKFKNCPTRCNLFSLLYFCRQLYMFRALTPNIRSSYNCNYSFWCWLTRSTTICSRC